jgi:hypothetical protein
VLDICPVGLPKWCFSPVGTANALVGALVYFSCRNCQCTGRCIGVFPL